MQEQITLLPAGSEAGMKRTERMRGNKKTPAKGRGLLRRERREKLHYREIR